MSSVEFVEFQSSFQTLAEAISLLDRVCSEDESCIPKVFEQMKNIGNKLSTSQCRVMIPLMQFFLNHSQ